MYHVDILILNSLEVVLISANHQVSAQQMAHAQQIAGYFQFMECEGVESTIRQCRDDPPFTLMFFSHDVAMFIWSRVKCRAGTFLTDSDTRSWPIPPLEMARSSWSFQCEVDPQIHRISCGGRKLAVEEAEPRCQARGMSSKPAIFMGNMIDP